MTELVHTIRPKVNALQPHSCSSCQELLITNDSSSCHFTEQFSYKKVVEKASSDCILFQSFQRKFNASVPPFLREQCHLILSPCMDSSDNSLQYLKSVFRIKRDIGPEDEYHLYPFAPDGKGPAPLIMDFHAHNIQ
jgi:hypothetical protein